MADERLQDQVAFGVSVFDSLERLWQLHRVLMLSTGSCCIDSKGADVSLIEKFSRRGAFGVCVGERLLEEIVKKLGEEQEDERHVDVCTCCANVDSLDAPPLGSHVTECCEHLLVIPWPSMATQLLVFCREEAISLHRRIAAHWHVDLHACVLALSPALAFISKGQ